MSNVKIVFSMSVFTTKHKLSIMNYSKLDIYVLRAVSKKQKKALLEFIAVKFAVFCQFRFKRVSSARARLSRTFLISRKPVTKVSEIKLGYFNK